MAHAKVATRIQVAIDLPVETNDALRNVTDDEQLLCNRFRRRRGGLVQLPVGHSWPKVKRAFSVVVRQSHIPFATEPEG